MIKCLLYNNSNPARGFFVTNNHKTILKSASEEISANSNPGKIILSGEILIQREKDLKLLADSWKKERLEREITENKMFGFSKYSELINGRVAMFFIMTGMLTEIWTKQSFLSQIEIMFRVLGIIN